jgi:hypothetical protein
LFIAIRNHAPGAPPPPDPRGLGGALSADDCAAACFCSWQLWTREKQHTQHVDMLEKQVPSPSK